MKSFSKISQKIPEQLGKSERRLSKNSLSVSEIQ